MTNSGASAATLTAGGNNSTTIFSGVLQDGTGGLGITKTGTGDADLGRHQHLYRCYDRDVGTLKAGSTLAFGTNSAVTVASNATLDLGGFSESIGSLSGTGTVTDNGAAAALATGGNNSSSTFGGIIRNGSGTIALSKSGTGTLTLSGANTYTGTTTVNAGTLTLSGSLNVGSNTATTVVASGATLSGTGVLTAASLADSGVGTVGLTGNNAVGAVSASGAGSFRFNDDQSLSLSSMNATGPIAVTTTLGSGANITLSSGAALSSSASGDAIVLAADGAFINNAGSAVLSAANGRWLVYSAAPGADAFGGLNSGNTAVWDANYGGTISQSGDRYVFAFQPTVTFTSSNASKIYGTDDTAAVAADYTVSALQPGVTGAFLGDSAATAFSGAPVVTSAGSAATATVTGGSYSITVAMGTLAGLNGYAVAVASPGNLTVTPTNLTITADNQSKVYGTNANLGTTAFATSGLLNSDSVSTVTLASTGAPSSANVGTYALTSSNATGTGLSNYTISYAAAPTGLTVTPASLTITADINRRRMAPVPTSA